MKQVMSWAMGITVVFALCLITIDAYANSISIVSATPVYDTVTHYNDVTVCTKGDDKTTEGAILGGLLGSRDGKAVEGAILGGILGDLVGQEKCKTEKRVSHTEKVYSHTVYVIELNGVQYTIKQ